MARFPLFFPTDTDAGAIFSPTDARAFFTLTNTGDFFSYMVIDAGVLCLNSLNFSDGAHFLMRPACVHGSVDPKILLKTNM